MSFRQINDSQTPGFQYKKCKTDSNRNHCLNPQKEQILDKDIQNKGNFLKKFKKKQNTALFLLFQLC